MNALKEIAKKENIPLARLKRNISAGRAVVLQNSVRGSVPCAIGSGVRTKVNANIGTAPDFCDLKEEVAKAKAAIEAGADTLMDLSIAGDLDRIRKRILKFPVPVGTVPVYQAVLESGSLSSLTADGLFRTIENHAKQGVDFITVHCGINRSVVRLIEKSRRVLRVVSRGGSLHARWIKDGEENPLFSEFDYLLDIAKRYGLALSLGDGMRPGCQADALDNIQLAELKNLGRLVVRARKVGVSAIVEGPGHVPFNKISAHIRYEKKVCHQAPYYVLGPIPTDIAAGYDHIAGAIGGAVAAGAGADFLCYVTPAEHLALPDVQDVYDGVAAFKVAARIGDSVKGIRDDSDLEISKARASLDWDGQFKHMLFPDKARKIREKRPPHDPKVCSMCGDLCAIKLSRF